MIWLWLHIPMTYWRGRIWMEGRWKDELTEHECPLSWGWVSSSDMLTEHETGHTQKWHNIMQR